jgi:hypothetical protein
MKLGSAEYVAEMVRRTNAAKDYLEIAKDQNDSYTLVFEPEPKKGVPASLVVGYQNQEGRISEAWQGERPTGFVLSAAYGVWVDILRGKTTVNKAVTMRQLKVRGNFLKLQAGSAATIAWLKVLTTIPTEFEGEYSQFNIAGNG